MVIHLIDANIVPIICAYDVVDLMEPGSILLLYGAEIQMYRGSMRLAVERSVQIIIAEPVEFVVCEDNNMSLTEYELVDVED